MCLFAGSSSRPKSALSNARPVPTVLQEMPVSNLEGATRREFELRRIIKDLEMQFDRQQQLASLYHDQVFKHPTYLSSGDTPLSFFLWFFRCSKLKRS